MDMQILELLRVSLPEAVKLRRRKYDLVRRYNLPETLMAGSVSRGERRCGRVNCRCVQKGELHEQHRLVVRLDDGRVCIPLDAGLRFEVAAMIHQRQRLLDAISELGSINARLLQLGRQRPVARSANMRWFWVPRKRRR